MYMYFFVCGLSCDFFFVCVCVSGFLHCACEWRENQRDYLSPMVLFRLIHCSIGVGRLDHWAVRGVKTKQSWVRPRHPTHWPNCA